METQSQPLPAPAPPKKKYANGPKYSCHTAISTHFPNKKQLAFMREEFSIREVRYCSVPDDRGLLPDFPRIDMPSWGWPVQLVFRRCDSGAREAAWAKFFDQLGLAPVENVPRESTRQLWKSIACQYAGDIRATELDKNCHDLILEVEIAVEIKAVEPILEAAKPTCDVAKKPPAPGMAGAAERMRIRVMMAAQKVKHAIKKSHKKKGTQGKKIPAMALPPPSPPSAPAPPPEPPYVTLFREFLSTENVYVRGKTKDLNIAGVIRSLITVEVYRNDMFFSTRNKLGFGMFFPCDETISPQAPPPPIESTLELHRRAIRLEWAGEAMLRALMAACEVGSSGLSFSKEDTTDAMDAMCCKGGINGQGADYWNEVPLSTRRTPVEGSMLGILCKMREARAAAFCRPFCYLVVDECSWGLPIATSLFISMRARMQQKAPPMDVHDFRQEISQLNNWRAHAIMQDRAPLVEYGRLLTAYCARLGEIVRQNPEVAASLPQGALEALPFCAESPPKSKDLTKKRIGKELEKLNATLKELGIEKSPAAQQVARVHASIAAAMASDSHQRAATSHLHPTRSLPGSAYNPLFYA